MPYGLEALIPKKNKKEVAQKKESVFWIEVSKIKPNPLQPRKEFKKEELKELADSIEKYGILQPLLAKKLEKTTPQGESVEYQLIAGERRLKAARIIGMKEVPVIIEVIKRGEELPISLVENIQREDLNPLEKAEAFKELIEKFNFTHKEIGKVLGKSRESVSNTLRLLELPEQIKEGVRGGKISEGHAKVLLSMDKEKQMRTFRETLEKNLSVRDMEERVKPRIIRRKGSETLLNVQKKIAKIEEVKNVRLKEFEDKIELTFLFQSKKDLEKFLKRLRKS
ncbi:MAG: ParB/RepB/Spo0J family partition protein [Patescibacteria group bacterium]